jgi:hypothetical protein
MSASITTLSSKTATTAKLKDEVLHERSLRWNVAQFASFDADLSLRFMATKSGATPADFEAAIRTVFAASGEASVNVRTFLPGNPQTTAFAYGLKSPEAAIAKVREFASTGLFTIVNETIDVGDGGVSGVLHAGRVEFAPQDTPRCVEKPGTCALEAGFAVRLFERVYGFKPAFDESPETRLEFSLHPLPRGCRSQHMIVWESGIDPASAPKPAPRWPNRFSKFMGDKAFGLLVADLCGLPVPETTVFPRRMAPFSFGKPTGSPVTWIRTCPNEQTPGLFTTKRGWMDPYLLLANEDPKGTAIASVLAMKEVAAKFSGAAITASDGKVILEGRMGYGDGFMQGQDLPEELPEGLKAELLALYDRASRILGPVRFEWVHDGKKLWVVQLHAGKTASRDEWIVEGEAETWHEIEAAAGLDFIREKVASFDPAKDGILLKGKVGFTSHIADVIRKAGIVTKTLAA